MVRALQRGSLPDAPCDRALCFWLAVVAAIEVCEPRPRSAAQERDTAATYEAAKAATNKVKPNQVAPLRTVVSASTGPRSRCAASRKRKMLVAGANP
jgi:hypothetical protein